MSALIIAFIIALALVAFVEGLRAFLPSMLRNAPKTARIIAERAEKEAEYLARRQEAQSLVMSYNMLVNDRAELETTLLQLEERQMLLDMDRPLLVIELGDPRAGNRVYSAGVSNRYAVANRIPPGMFETPLNKIWARENLVEVWAQALIEARNTIENNYPRNRGFEITFHGEALEGDAK